MTPSTVHYGKGSSCSRHRQTILDKAFRRNPERFVSGSPRTLTLPEAAWINPPAPRGEPEEEVTAHSITIIGTVR